MAKVGRPSSYDEKYHCKKAFDLCLLGATDKMMADFFEVSEQTLNTWKKEHPEFLESLKKGKEEADAEIAKSLYHRAKGYSHPDLYITQHQGEIIKEKITKHYPPDPTAMIFWLKNRHPEQWRDKRDIELTGEDGGPVKYEIKLPEGFPAKEGAPVIGIPAPVVAKAAGDYDAEGDETPSEEK